ncbi:MAG: lycopene cyclase domain-containing protein [Bacteroidota bacterium]
MLYIGIFLCGAGPACEFFSIPAYWNPDFILGTSIPTPLGIWKFGIEDLIGPVGIVGIAVFIFELFHKPFNGLHKLSIIPIIRILGITLLGLLMICIFFFIFNINGIHACNLSSAVLSILIILLKPSYLRTTTITAILCTILYWLVLQLVKFIISPDVFNVVWNPDGRLGIMVAGVPIEELIWAFFLAMIVGPLYRVAHDIPNNEGKAID